MGNLRKEFTKEELLIADNLWTAYSLILALRQMRSQTALISQANQETRQYSKHLVDSTGIISYAEMTGELRIHKYRKLRFTVTFMVNAEGTLADSEKLSNRIKASASVML